jgi:hypothetical protein
LTRAIERVTNNAPCRTSISLSEKLADGSSHLSKTEIAETERICDLGTYSVQVDVYLEGDLDNSPYLALNGRGDSLDVYVMAKEAQAAQVLLEEVQTGLGLQLWAEPGLRQNTILRRLEALEATVRAVTGHLRCFLSYRFTTEVEPLAAKLQRFFGLLDVEVVTGAGYEPRPIIEKVKAKLGLDLHFVVLIVSIHGESMWTRDEITSAGSRGIPVIPLVEHGADFAPGLFGDLEYIPFTEGRIEETFIKLLEAIRFVRLQKSQAAPEVLATSASVPDPTTK